MNDPLPYRLADTPIGAVTIEDWFYRMGDRALGPIPRVELERLLSTRQIGPAVQVWKDGMPSWVPAARVPGLVPPEGGLQFIVPTGRTSASSLAAGYLGLFGIVVLPLAPAALVLGILGVRDLRKNPEKNGWGRAITGIALGGLMTLIALAMLLSLLTR